MTDTPRRWTLRKATQAPYDTVGASVIGPNTEPVEVVPAADALTAEALTAQLDAMQLFDNTGNCFDEGYMAAVRELRVWLRRIAGDSKEGTEDG